MGKVEMLPERNHSKQAAARQGEGRTRYGNLYKEIWFIQDNKRDNGKAFWSKIGVAFQNRDESWTLKLSAVPIGEGSLHMRDPKPKEAAA